MWTGARRVLVVNDVNPDGLKAHANLRAIELTPESDDRLLGLGARVVLDLPHASDLVCLPRQTRLGLCFRAGQPAFRPPAPLPAAGARVSQERKYRDDCAEGVFSESEGGERVVGVYQGRWLALLTEWATLECAAVFSAGGLLCVVRLPFRGRSALLAHLGGERRLADVVLAYVGLTEAPPAPSGAVLPMPLAAEHLDLAAEDGDLWTRALDARQHNLDVQLLVSQA